MLSEIKNCWIIELTEIKRVDLKSSTFLVSATNVKDQCLKTCQDRKVNFDAGDMHKVFDILSRPRDIGGVHGHTIVDFIDFLNSNNGMIGNDSHSSKKAEKHLPRDITKLSSEADKACFDVACVIFTMANPLIPSSKHDYTTIDYWEAICRTDYIVEYNWGGCNEFPSCCC